MRNTLLIALISTLVMISLVTACTGTFEVGVIEAHESDADWGVFATVAALERENAQLVAAVAAKATATPPAGRERELLTLRVYFGNSRLNPEMIDCSLVFPVERQVAEPWSVAEAALDSLFAGPNEEEMAEGYVSVFSDNTRTILRSVTFRGTTAYVDLTDIRELIPAANSSCGSQAFFAEIESTLKAIVPVDRVIYAIYGDPVRFYEWIQLGCGELNDNCDPTPFAGIALRAGRPTDTVEKFYSWYIEYVRVRGNPLADRAYRESAYLAPELIREIDQMLDGFHMGGADPFLCAQDIPQSIVIGESTTEGDKATVMVHTAWAGSPPRDLRVDVRRIEETWVITEIHCPLPAEIIAPHSPPATGDGRSLHTLQEGLIYLTRGKTEGALVTLPEEAVRFSLGSRYIAFELDGMIHALNLEDGAARPLLDLDDRPGLDVQLRWSHDGSTLAYTLAWNEDDGSRMVELGMTDGYAQTVIDTLVARPAGPTPTPPAFPPVEPEPGFSTLSILGLDRITGRLVAMPVGGQEGLLSLWTYDLRVGGPAHKEPLPFGRASAYVPSLSPDLERLAVFTQEGLQVYQMAKWDASAAPVGLPHGTHPSWLVWSPDSRYLAFLLTEGEAPGLDVSPSLGLWLWDSQSGEGGPLIAEMSPEASLLGWTTDGAEIVLQMLDGISRQVVIKLISQATGNIRVVDLPEDGWVLGVTSGRP